MKLIDCHAHLTDVQFDTDRNEIMASCRENEICVVTVGMTYADFPDVLNIANGQYILFGLGLHPIQGGNHGKGDIDKRPLVKADTLELTRWLDSYSEECICLGECGLDFSKWLCPTSTERDNQREALVEQIKLSKRYNLPLNLHSRSAGKPLLKLLKENNYRGALLHAFDGGKKAIKQGVEGGHYFSVAPSIVRDPSQQLVATTVPLDRLVLESDSPGLGPVKGERNTPLNLLKTVEVLAELLGCSKDHIAQVTTQNAVKLFPKLEKLSGFTVN